MRVARRMIIGLGTVNVLALVLIAVASAHDGSWGTGPEALPDDALPVSQVARELEGEGLRRIYRIEADGAQYRVRALDASGHRVELSVDPRTGQILH